MEDQRQAHLPIFVNVGGTQVMGIKYTDYIRSLDKDALDTRQYLYPRNKGMNPDDTTSFIRSQQDWGGERDQRPSILFQLYRPRQYAIPNYGYLFTPAPSKSFPLLMVVIDDYTSQPLRNVPELPIKISTTAEGWLLEAWVRLNPGLTHDDIMSRMPHLPAEERRRPGSQAFKGAKNRLGGRRRDFRIKGRCISWEPNASLKSVFDLKIFEEIGQDCHALEQGLSQSTRHLADLSKREIEELKTLAHNNNPEIPTSDPNTPDSTLNTDASPTAVTEADNANQYTVPKPPKTRLLAGADVQTWLDSKGFAYNPAHKLPLHPDPFSPIQDWRLQPPTSPEDTRQLFLSLCPSIHTILHTHAHSHITLPLASYATSYNVLQDQFLHAICLTLRPNPILDLNNWAARFEALPPWAEAMGNWDISLLQGDVRLMGDRRAREDHKAILCPYVMSEAFRVKAHLHGLIGEEGELVFGFGSVVVGGRVRREMGGWEVELLDFE